AGEPLVRVRAPVIEGQLVETFLLATVNHQTLIATKAARVVEAAAGKGVIEFGARRAHGFHAALFGARAALIGGCIGTSNTLAAAGAPIDLYGVDTDLATSRDAPALGGVYKLVAIEAGGERRAVRKLGAEKATYPEPKQVYRRRGPDGRFTEDLVALATETLA